MDDTPTDHFGADIAAGYDASVARRFHEDDLGPTVDFLADLAAGRPALELGIGTGRVALPLSRRGVRVVGIDLSPAMVDKLREKPGGDEIDVEIGDFATTTVDGPFGLVFLVFSTISNLTTQDAQVACFRNAAAHLESGGYFVIEVGVPDLRRLPPGERARVFDHGDGHTGFDVYVDIPNQLLESHHHVETDDGVLVHHAPFRYVFPSELDLMARLAGLELVDRWEGWRREPFTEASERHVSVWRKV